MKREREGEEEEGKLEVRRKEENVSLSLIKMDV